MRPRIAWPNLYRTVVDFCRSAGFEPKLGQEAPQFATIISLVAAELGVSIVPSSMQQSKGSGVVYLPMEGPQIHVTLSLAWRRSERSKVVQNFAALVREQSRLDQLGDLKRAG